MTKAINNVQKAKDKELPNFQPEKGLNKCENSNYVKPSVKSSFARN